MAGIVESVGQDVTQFRPGDEVFASSSGALAEYACTPEKQAALKPWKDGWLISLTGNFPKDDEIAARLGETQ